MKRKEKEREKVFRVCAERERREKEIANGTQEATENKTQTESSKNEFRICLSFKYVL